MKFFVIYAVYFVKKKKREEIKPLQKQKLKLFIKKKFKNIDGST